MQKTYDTSGHLLFEEKQRFPVWLYVLVIGIVSLTVLGMLLMAVVVEPASGEALVGLGITISVEGLVVYLFLRSELETVVTTNGFYYRWKPLHKKYRVLEKEEIERVEVRRPPMLNYGYGWFPGLGRFYNANNGEGIQLFLRDGGKIFFGTADKDIFLKAVEQMISSNRKSQLREF